MAINCSSGLIVSSVADSAGNVYSLAAGPLASPGQGNVDSLPHGNRLDLREQRRKFEPVSVIFSNSTPGNPALYGVMSGTVPLPFVSIHAALRLFFRTAPARSLSPRRRTPIWPLRATTCSLSSVRAAFPQFPLPSIFDGLSNQALIGSTRRRQPPSRFFLLLFLALIESYSSG